jgi:1-acyl-sn-glycerol-3-phosphate acyltransferase
MNLLKWYDIDSIDNRDPEYFDRVVKHKSPWLYHYHKMEMRGIDRVSPGAGLYVGNHNSAGYAPDTFYFIAEIYRTYGLKEVPYGLAHEGIIQMPVFHQMMVPCGAVRASHENASRLFARDNKVLVYPGGDVDAYRPYRHRNRIVFGGRTGYIRLALKENVPIYPVVAAGAHSMIIVIDDLRPLARLTPASHRTKVWPLTLSFPWGLSLGPIYIPPLSLPMNILMEILDPIRFERSGKEAADDESYVRQCADYVELAMQNALDLLANELDDKRS